MSGAVGRTSVGRSKLENQAILCPGFEDHTESPAGYIQWHSWAERMSKTHRQRKCRGCGLYVIWEPKA